MPLKAADNLSISLLAQTIIYGVDACDDTVEVAVGLQGLVAMTYGAATLGIPYFLRYADFKAETRAHLQIPVGRCCIKTKKSQITLRLDFERKTRLEPAFAGISRELFLHPQPLRGECGSVVNSSGEVKKIMQK